MDQLEPGQGLGQAVKLKGQGHRSTLIVSVTSGNRKSSATAGMADRGEIVRKQTILNCR